MKRENRLGTVQNLGNLLAAGCISFTFSVYPAEIFQTSFDGGSNHSWKTDEPENFFVNEADGVFKAKLENLAPSLPDYTPNRYAVVEVDLDPSQSFELMWEQLNHFEGIGSVSFGLFSADLRHKNDSPNQSPRLKSASTLNLTFRGNQTEGGDNWDLRFIGHNRVENGYGGFQRQQYDGDWLICRLVYDSDSRSVSFSVSRRIGEDITLLLNDSIEGVHFFPGMHYLGLSNSQAGRKRNDALTNNPEGFTEVKIDNIRLTGTKWSESHPTELIRKPDLEITKLAFDPPSVVIGEQEVKIAVTVRNNGPFHALPSVLRFRLSMDAGLDKSDPGLEPLDFKIGELIPGTEREYVVLRSIPSDLKSGSYYVGVFADAHSELGQVDENNDSRVSRRNLIVNRQGDRPVFETSTPIVFTPNEDGSRGFSLPFWAEKDVPHSVQSFSDITFRAGEIVQNILGSGEFFEVRFRINPKLTSEFFLIGKEGAAKAPGPTFHFPLEGSYSELRITGYDFGEHWLNRFCISSGDETRKLRHT